MSKGIYVNCLDLTPLPAVMYVAVRHGRYRLAEVVRRIDGLKYPAAAQAVRRFGERLASDPDMQRFVESLRRHLGDAT